MKWVPVREAARLGGIVIVDSSDRPFKRRRLLPAYQELLAADAFRGGTDSTQILGEDREDR